MTPIHAAALSGAQVASKRVAASAHNVANAQTAVAPAEAADAPGPVRVEALSVAGGGVRGQTRFLSPGYLPAHAPDHPAAGADGRIARADVSLEGEAVRQIAAQRAYEANLQVLKVGDRMLGALLDHAS